MPFETHDLISGQEIEEMKLADFEKVWLTEEPFTALPLGELVNSEGAFLYFATDKISRCVFVRHPRGLAWWNSLKERIVDGD